MKVALFGRTIEHKSHAEIARLLEKIYAKKGIKTLIYSEFCDYLKSLKSEKLARILKTAATFTGHKELPQDTDLFLSLGGDGTFLSGVPLVRHKNIPMAGINFGRLGFLTATTPKCDEWLEALLCNKFVTEKRTLLQCECSNMPEDFYPCALNEISIQRNSPAVLELKIKIDGVQIPQYMADGVLVATATGSTAYSLSAGGPIVLPQGKVLTLVPIAPHNLNIRPLVIPDTSSVEVSFSTRYANATLTTDNRSFAIPNNTSVKIRRAHNVINMVAGQSDFMNLLSEKLFWGADWRNVK